MSPVFRICTICISICCALSLLCSCEARSENAVEVLDDKLSAQQEFVNNEDENTITTPFYSVHLPDSWQGRYHHQYSSPEYSLTGDTEFGPTYGHSLSIFLDDSKQCEFFVTATKRIEKDGDPVFPQGRLYNRCVGEVQCENETWSIIVSKASLSQSDENDDSEVLFDEYCSYVTPGLNMQACSDCDFINFLGSETGEEWSHGESEKYAKERIEGILKSGIWGGTNSGFREGTVRERDTNFYFDFAALSFGDGRLDYLVPLSDDSISISYPDETRSATSQWKLLNWSAYTDQPSYTDTEQSLHKIGLTLEIAESSDDGETWRKQSYLLYSAVPYAASSGFGNLNYLCFGKPEHASYYTLENVVVEAVKDQERCLSEANKLLLSYRQTEGDDELSDPNLKCAFALPALFEDYSFDVVDGYYIKMEDTLNEDTAIYKVFYIYENGDGSITAHPTAQVDTVGKHSDLF